MANTAKLGPVEFDTRDYRASHGCEPRPNESGTWAFCTVAPSGNPDYLDYTIWANGTYVAARREVARVAQERGIEVLYVCG